jgi:hypothetical protein
VLTMPCNCNNMLGSMAHIWHEVAHSRSIGSIRTDLQAERRLDLGPSGDASAELVTSAINCGRNATVSIHVLIALVSLMHFEPGGVILELTGIQNLGLAVNTSASERSGAKHHGRILPSKPQLRQLRQPAVCPIRPARSPRPRQPKMAREAIGAMSRQAQQSR